MTEDDRNGHASTAQADRVAGILGAPAKPERRRGRLRRRRTRGPRRRIRWLRVVAIALPLSFLALISFVFGIVLAYEPQLSSLLAKLKVNYSVGETSTVYALGNKEIGILTAGTQVFLPPKDIPKVMADAIVSVEDKRFWTEPGVDIRGIARAFVADVFGGGGVQGASTITEQFVKLALHEENKRTLLVKLREAGMAFQLAHLWQKPTILADYLDTAYFGNGAYGVEAAAKAYFSADPSSPLYGCGLRPSVNNPKTLCVTYLTPDEAALLAAAVDAPSDFNQLQDAGAAMERRNLVLRDMAAQGYIAQSALANYEATSLPPPQDIGAPEQGTSKSDGYFVNWIENQMLARYGPKIFTAGYHIHTTLDQQLQNFAQNTIGSVLPPGTGQPAAALVAIDNATGQVRAMVGGYNYYKDPYNLAVQGERQPGSSFKVFDLAAALLDGYGPKTKVYSHPFDHIQAPFGDFVVRNDEGGYYNAKIPLSLALAVSDNSVFSRVGLNVGPRNIAKLANLFGITTSVSINPSMVIGGLHIGVTPLDMAHAYETIAQDGTLVSGTLASQHCASGFTQTYSWEEAPPVGIGPGGSCPGPVGIQYIGEPNNEKYVYNRTHTYAVYPDPSKIKVEKQMMKGVLSPIGTAASAAIPGVQAWGKTGTTNSYVDAWFVGSTPKMGRVPSMTVAVWVGYPAGAKSMKHNFHGGPVYGGTFPAEIWRRYVEYAISVYQHPPVHHSHSSRSGSSGTSSTTTSSSSSSTTTTTTQANSTGASGPASTGAQQAGGTSQTGTGGTSTGAGAGSPTKPNTATTVTSGGGSSSPTGTPPAVTTPATTTPAAGAPNTGTGGGVTAPSTGGAGPPGGRRLPGGCDPPRGRGAAAARDEAAARDREAPLELHRARDPDPP